MKIISLLALLVALTCNAQLEITVSPLKIAGQKILVPLVMQNNFNQKIESARASVFLLDEKGKMVGQSTKWVIGGTPNRTGLAHGATNSFFFVITSDKPLATTNLTTKVNFNRVVLEGGKLGNPAKDVKIEK